MMRWVAGLAAVLVLPACGDGPGAPSGTNAEGRDPTGQPPSVRIISPDSGSSSPEGSTLTIRAVATDPDAVIERVEFYDDTRLIGSKSSPPYTISTRRLESGTHVLCAVAIDHDGIPVASPPVTLFVVQGKGDDEEDGDGDGHDRKR